MFPSIDHVVSEHQPAVTQSFHGRRRERDEVYDLPHGDKLQDRRTQLARGDHDVTFDRPEELQIVESLGVLFLQTV